MGQTPSGRSHSCNNVLDDWVSGNTVYQWSDEQKTSPIDLFWKARHAMNGLMLEDKEGLSYSHILPKTNLAPENGWLEDKPLLLKWFLFRGHVDFFWGGTQLANPYHPCMVYLPTFG